VGKAPACALGESPYWCAVSNTLFFIDIAGKKLHRLDPAKDAVDTMTFNECVGFAVPSARSAPGKALLYVGLESTVVEVNFADAKTVRVVSAVGEKDVKDRRFNDGKCSPAGRLYCGYMHNKWRDGHCGQLYTLAAGDSLRPVFDPNTVQLPNGMAWPLQHTGETDGIVYMVDSGAHEIRKYKEVPHEPTAPDGGSAAADPNFPVTRRGLRLLEVVYTLPEAAQAQGHMMDGMTIDADGQLWVALVNASCLIRVDPTLQKEIMRVELPAKKPTCCTFGGPDLATLYVTSRSDVAPAPGPGDGKLYAVRIDGVRGLAAGVPVAVEKV